MRHRRHRDLGPFAQQTSLNGSRVTIFDEQNRLSFSLVVTSNKAVVHQDFWYCVLVLGNYGAAGYNAAQLHTRRTTNGMANGLLHEWLSQQRPDHAGLEAVSLCAPLLPRLLHPPPTQRPVLGRCVRVFHPVHACRFAPRLTRCCSTSTAPQVLQGTKRG